MNTQRPEWLAQMEDILETLNQGVMILDDCRNILFINSQMEEMFGFPASEVVGRNGISFYNEDERKVMLRPHRTRQGDGPEPLRIRPSRERRQQVAGHHQFARISRIRTG